MYTENNRKKLANKLKKKPLNALWNSLFGTNELQQSIPKIGQFIKKIELVSVCGLTHGPLQDHFRKNFAWKFQKI